MKRSILTSLITFSFLVNAFAQYEQFDYPGATDTYVTGMNDIGDFVGYYTSGGITKGFYVIGTDTADMVYPAAVSTWAYGISNQRKIVGKYNGSGSNADNEGFMFDYGTFNYTDLTYLVTGGGQFKEVRGINDSQCWVGNLRANSSTYLTYSCPNYGTSRKNLLATYGTALNEVNDLAGYYIDGAAYTSFIRVGAVYTDVSYPGQIKTRVYGMNNSNMVVGDFANQRGFIYDGFLTGGTAYEEIEIPDALSVTPQDINNNDEVCGYFTDATGNVHGFFVRAYDIGFRPNPDGWNFANDGDLLWTMGEYVFYSKDPYLKQQYGTEADFPTDSLGQIYIAGRFPSWPLFVNTFKESNTYTRVNGVLKYRPKAVEYWDKISGLWTGSCLGINLTSLMNYDNAGWFAGQNPEIPQGFPSIFSLDTSKETRLAINRAQTLQFADFNMQWKNQHYRDTPNQTLQSLKAMMSDTAHDHATISMFNPRHKSGMHSLTPFKIERDDNNLGWENVYVHDSNFPNDTTRHIRINKNADAGGEWYYEASLNSSGMPEEWGGADANAGIFINPKSSEWINYPSIGTIEFAPSNQSRSTGGITTFFSKYAEEYFLYGNDSLGYVNGDIHFNTSNGVPIQDANGVVQAPLGYYLDGTMNHQAHIINAQSPHVFMSVFSETEMFSFERDDATPAQTDVADIDDGLTYTNPDADAKNVQLKAFLSDAGTSYHYWIDAVSCEQNAQLHVQSVNTNELIVTNTGSAKTYELTISILSPTDASTFEVANVPFAANGIHHIVPHWGNLADDGIYITVDTLLSGVDDTLFLANQALPNIALSDGEMYYANAAGTDTVFVINLGGGHLNWNVSSAPSWITVLEGNSGVDDDIIVFDYQQNSGADRSDWLVISSDDPNSPDSILIVQSTSGAVGVETLQGDESFVIYPNPTRNVLNIGFSSQMENATVQLYDLNGRAVTQAKYQHADGSLVKLNLEQFSSGIYFLSVQTDSETVVRKIVRQ